MFVAIRDLRFAKGRFALMGAVVVMITMLVVLLSGLTAGLGRANVSAITDLPADHLVFSAPADGASISFSDSTLDQQVQQQWAAVPGVLRADPLSVAMTRAEIDGRSTGVAAFSVTPGSSLAPAPVAPGSVVLSDKAAADLGLAVGDRLTLGGRSVTVHAVAGDAQYSHADVIWTAMADAPATGSVTGSATVIALTTSGADLAAADAALHTSTVSTADAVSGIGSYAAENGSLQLMRILLFAISALVVGAFFTVWTVQRSPEVAVLKALGAATGYLLRDALGQALILLIGGTAVGTALAAGLGALAVGTVPFVLDLSTLLLPAAVMVVLGLAGAAVSLRRITSVDPLTALGSAR